MIKKTLMAFAGLQHSITLQPISVGAQRGLNAAVGIGGLELLAR
jgi:hypothetical protein